MAHDHTFRSPIPGSSLSQHRLGDMLHEKPPKHVDPNEACEFIWKQLHNKVVLKQLWQLLETGAPVSSISRAVLYKMALEGVIQINLAIVIYPIVNGMIETLGKSKGIKNLKQFPKVRDPIKDSAVNNHINQKLGQNGNNQIPNSVLKIRPIPKAEDITKGANQLKKIVKTQPQGLLNQTGNS